MRAYNLYPDLKLEQEVSQSPVCSHYDTIHSASSFAQE
jgi:hypothetical protein